MDFDEMLLNSICLADAINDCCLGEKNCSECDCVLREMIAEHDKEVKNEVIDDFADEITKLLNKRNTNSIYQDDIHNIKEIVKAGAKNE